MSKDIKIDEDSYLMLLNSILTNKKEERELALDRYRKTDENMTTNDHFVVMGKNAVSFLRLASDTTNDLAGLAKEIKSLVFKEDSTGNPTQSVSDLTMKMVIDKIKESEENENLNQEDKRELLSDDSDEDN